MMSFISFAIILLSQQVAANCTEGCNCVAVPREVSGHWNVADEHCAPCAAGQTWWPCNLDGACKCDSETDAPVEEVTTDAPVEEVTTDAPVEEVTETAAPIAPVNPDRPCDSCGSCEAQPNNPHNASDEHCAPCANGGQSWWPCNQADLCQCSGNSNPEEPATNPEEPATNPEEPATNPEEPATNPEEPATNPEEPATNPEEPATETDNSHVDTTTRKAQASVFGDYANHSWDQVTCSADESDAKPYMQARTGKTQHPNCAVAINMGKGAFKDVDQNGKPGFCKRTSPGNGAARSSACWKVRCVGSENSLGLGVTCKHNDWVYLKTVDTNTENDLSLTDDEYTAKCSPIAETQNDHSCRAFDITVQAWDLMVVFAANQGSMAGEPAGLNGVVPVEYEEVDCNDTVAAAAIADSQCGLNPTLLI
jgi:hypothetical protein